MPPPPPPRVPTWKISLIAGGHYLWLPVDGSAADGEALPKETLIPNTSSPRFPSMTDFFFLAASLRDPAGGRDGDGGISMFGSGSGENAPVEVSSVRKSKSVMEDLDEGVSKSEKRARDEGMVRKRDSSSIHNAMVEGDGDRDGAAPMFQMGSGRIREGSVRKEMSILGEKNEERELDDDVVVLETQCHIDGGTNPMFQTGYGRSVSIREGSMRKAMSIAAEKSEETALDDVAVLETQCHIDEGMGAERSGDQHDANPMFQTGCGRTVCIREGSIRKGMPILGEKSGETGLNGVAVLETRRSCTNEGIGAVNGGGLFNAVPMFQTGSGRSVTIREDSIRKAMSVLEEKKTQANGDGNKASSMFQTGLGMSSMILPHAIQKAASILGDVSEEVARDDVKKLPMEDCFDEGRGVKRNLDDNDVVPMFQTGSGRSVTINGSSITKATTILEGSRTVARDGRNATILQVECQKPNSARQSFYQKEMSCSNNGTCMGKNDDDDDIPMFQTGSGRSVTIKWSSIQKATSILGGKSEERTEQNGNTDISPAESRESVALVQHLNQHETHFAYEGTAAARNSNAVDAIPMFQTGSGRSVTIKRSSIQKATSILDENNQGGPCDNDNVKILPEVSVEVKPYSDNDTYCFDKLMGRQRNGDGDDAIPMFQSGSGRCITIRQSSIQNAASILGEAESSIIDSNGLRPMTGLKSFNNRKRLSRKTAPLLPGQEGKDPGCMGPLKPSSDDFIRPTLMISLEHVSGPVDGPSRLMDNELDRVNSNYLKDASLNNLQPDPLATTSSPSSIKFHRANGESLLVSHDALQRARSLLGDSYLGVLPNDETTADVIESITRDPVKKNEYIFQEGIRKSSTKSYPPISSIEDQGASFKVIDNSKIVYGQRSSCKPLSEICNNIDANIASSKCFADEKKRFRRKCSPSPFKKPRKSRFTAPLKNVNYSVHDDVSFEQSMSNDSSHKPQISFRYPFHSKRPSLVEFFGGPPSTKMMSAGNVDKYEICSKSGLEMIGIESFRNMMLQSGASPRYLTKQWVSNHYKWIVWKLACLERGYPTQASGKFLTVANVLEELKYRYEREVNYGHRSVVKKILDGDVSPASMVVLCISAVCPNFNAEVGVDNASTTNYPDKLRKPTCSQSNIAKIELTDGWYSLEAVLDKLLSEYLLRGKLFIGQKLRIWGASLHGWVGPITPFEAVGVVNLLIHANGTYRTHWADKLGLCKNVGAPLSLNCIKGEGGRIPKVLIGVSRIYPILYKERFCSGGSVVRPERIEMKVLQMYKQRCDRIAEDVISEQKHCSVDDTDSEEGAKISKILENAAEPELLMADMSSEQLASFSAYRTKQAELMQLDLNKKIEKTMDDAGLGPRDVTPFLRVRVVGLRNKGCYRKSQPREGLVTIWNPTAKQKFDLVEGQIYSVSGLVPLTVGSGTISLQARSSTTWKSISSHEMFEPFFVPRKSIRIVNLGEAPLASEFDMAALILHVGEAYVSGHQKKQWIFVTDGSVGQAVSRTGFLSDGLLAINFCVPCLDSDSFPPLNQALSGSVIGFYNLIKRPRDQSNHVWVADATENSTYASHHSLSRSHLKEAADAAKEWAKISSTTIMDLKKRVSHIIGGCGGQGS